MNVKENKIIYIDLAVIAICITICVNQNIDRWESDLEYIFTAIIWIAGAILVWKFLALLLTIVVVKIQKEDKCKKSKREIADDLCDKIFNLKSDDKNTLYKRLYLEDEKNKVKKEIDRRSQEYWMDIWKIVYNIQKNYPEKGYLEYADSNLSKKYQSFWGAFSDNNYITFITLVLSILSLVGQENVDKPLIVLIEMVTIVAFENLKSYLQKDEPERAENERCREIIEGVLNASKK